MLDWLRRVSSEKADPRRPLCDVGVPVLLDRPSRFTTASLAHHRSKKHEAFNDGTLITLEGSFWTG